MAEARVKIAMAIIAVVGSVGAAALANWDKLFPPGPPVDEPGSLNPDPFFLAGNRSSFIVESNIFNDLQWERVYWQEGVYLGDQKYHRALGMHAPDKGVGYADFRVPSGARFFHVVFGLAKVDSDPNPENYGHAVGRVRFDEEVAWQAEVSGPAPIFSPAIAVPKGAKRLRLEVDSDGSNWGDHTTWGDPNFTSK